MTLYANEAVLWNPDTDAMEKVKSEQSEDLAKEAILEGRALSRLKEHEGFKVLSDYLTGTVADLTNRLTVETDFKRFRRLQEAVKAYTNVLAFVDFKIQEGKALEQLQTPEIKE